MRILNIMKLLNSVAALILLSALCSCGQTIKDKSTYPDHVGDITFNKNVDDPNFKVCNQDRPPQYYEFGKGLQYEGEKPAIISHFKEKLKNRNLSGQTGYLTIRFIVNCEGKTGFFRIEGIDKNLEKMDFNKELVSEILEVTKQLNKWGVPSRGNTKFDFYQYLTFKLEDGRLIEIMP